jgi:hypothetical protein
VGLALCICGEADNDSSATLHAESKALGKSTGTPGKSTGTLGKGTLRTYPSFRVPTASVRWK